MGNKLSSYWRSETVSEDKSGGQEDEPTCDPKSVVNGHSSDSGDEDTQQDQDGGNLDDRNDNESDDIEPSSGLSSTKDNYDHEKCVNTANGGEDDEEEIKSKEPEANYKHGSNNGVDNESCNEAMENGTNGGDAVIPIILLNDIFSQEHSSSSSQLADSRNDFTTTNPAEQARITYAAVSRNHNKVLMGTHQRQSQLTLESRKREHSADSDRSTPNYQHAYLNELPVANRSKKAKSSETDSVSSSRSDRASTEIEQITPKVAKSRKRRAKPAKKYLS